MSWMQLLAASLGGGGLAGIGGSLITGLLTRPKVRADAMSVLTDAAIKQVNELQERTAEAEREATAARNDLAQARQQIRLLTAEIDMAMAKMMTWRTAILASVTAADLERLHAMVHADPGPASTNGRHYPGPK